MASEEKTNTADSVKKAAGSAATVAKAAGKAASGNYVGAAVDALSNENTRRIIILAIILPAMIITYFLFMVMFVYPMAMYEALQELWANATAAFWEGFYGENGGIKAIVKGIGNFFTSIWDAIKTKARSNTDDNIDINADQELQVATEPESLSPTLLTKVTMVKEKYAARVEDILAAIDRDASHARTLRCRDHFSEHYLSKSDGGYDKFTGATWNTSAVVDELSDLQALYYVALYSLTMDNDYGEIETIDFLRWLGWEKFALLGWGQDTMQFQVFGADVSVTGWKGTYMPQYLTDEMKQNAEEAGLAAKKEAEGSHSLFTSEEREAKNKQKAYSEAYSEVTDDYQKEKGTSAIDIMTWAYVPGSVTPTAVDGPNDEAYNMEKKATCSLYDYQGSIESYEKDYVILPTAIDTDSRTKASRQSYPSAVYSRHANDYNDAIRYYTTLVSGQEESPTENDPDKKGEIESTLYWESATGRYDKTVYFTVYLDPVSYSDHYYSYRGDASDENLRNAIKRAFSSCECEFNGYGDVAFKINGSYGVPTKLSFTGSGTVSETYTYWIPKIEYKVWHYYKEVSYSVPIYIAPRVKTAMLEISGILDGDHSEDRRAFFAASQNAA